MEGSKDNHFAYDISKNVISKGEIFDEDVINQSIELILATILGERIFNPSFGSELPLQIFENFTNSTAESLIDRIVDAIEIWEDRIQIIHDSVEFKLSRNENSLVIGIPYYIKKQKIVSFFNKKIIF